jgi:hypothetical protein
MAKTLIHIHKKLAVLALLSAMTLPLALAPISVAHDTLSVATVSAQQQVNTSSTATASSDTSNPSAGQIPADCSFWNGTLFINFFTCVGASFSGFVSAILVSISSTFLAIAGTFFDWILYHTVVAFGDFVNNNVIDAINTAWSAFRDIANIVIIAMFVFVAIQTILGSHEYGAKKMVARIFIVAVLINFSLLFTKMIIDGSNYFAVVFYNATMPTQGTATTGTGDAQVADISGAFMSYAGVTGAKDTYAAVSTMAKQPNSFFGKALLFGILVALLYLAATVVLLYGTFLLVSRAILMIFLMVTSSIAFATYLIPGAAGSSYGWSAWWSALLKNAVFAPMLMVFLWMSLLIGQYFKVTNGTLGDLVANPTKQVDTAALFGYIIVIGLLFASFKAASSFSKEIGGFNWASIAPGIGFAAASRVGGVIGRNTVGLGAQRASDYLFQRGKDSDNALAQRLYNFGAQQLKGASQRDFNAMRSGLGTAIAGTVGTKIDTLAGKQIKGYEGAQKTLAKDLADAARRMERTSDETAKKIQDGKDKQLAQDPVAKARYESAEALKKSRAADHTREESIFKNLEASHANDMKRLQDTLAAAVTAAHGKVDGSAERAEVDRIQREVAAKKAEHKTELDRQTDRIKTAKVLSDQAEREFKTLDDSLLAAAKESGKIPKNIERTAQQIAGNMARNATISGLLYRAVGSSNERLAKLAEKEVGSQQRKHHVEESGLVEAIKHFEGHEEKKPAETHEKKDEHPKAPTGGGGAPSH